MILPQTYPVVLALMILSALCLGSWPATYKLAGKWRFELFYFSFAFGLIVAAGIYAFTVGNLGYDGFTLIDDLQHAGKRQWLFGFIAGLIFNFANMLLMASVSVAGMAVAFPISIGLAVLVSTAMSSFARPAGNGLLLTLGCLLLLTAIIVDALSYRLLGLARHEALARAGQAKSTRRPSSLKGIILALASGLLMGSFNPLLDKARAGEVGMGPYAIMVMFGLGAFFTTPVFNIFFMNLPVEGDPVDFGNLLSSKLKQHIMGFIGGMIWCTGMLAALVVVASADQIQVTPVARNILSQVYPVIAAVWGLVVFREFKGADIRVTIMSVLMLVLFLVGVGMIAMAPVYIPGKS